MWVFISLVEIVSPTSQNRLVLMPLTGCLSLQLYICHNLVKLWLKIQSPTTSKRVNKLCNRNAVERNGSESILTFPREQWIDQWATAASWVWWALAVSLLRSISGSRWVWLILVASLSEIMDTAYTFVVRIRNARLTEVQNVLVTEDW